MFIELALGMSLLWNTSVDKISSKYTNLINKTDEICEVISYAYKQKEIEFYKIDEKINFYKNVKVDSIPLTERVKRFNCFNGINISTEDYATAVITDFGEGLGAVTSITNRLSKSIYSTVCEKGFRVNNNENISFKDIVLAPSQFSYKFKDQIDEVVKCDDLAKFMIFDEKTGGDLYDKFINIYSKGNKMTQQDSLEALNHVNVMAGKLWKSINKVDIELPKMILNPEYNACGFEALFYKNERYATDKSWGHKMHAFGKYNIEFEGFKDGHNFYTIKDSTNNKNNLVLARKKLKQKFTRKQVYSVN